MTGFLLFVLFAGVILAFVSLGGAKKRVELLEANVRYMRDELERMRQRLEDLAGPGKQSITEPPVERTEAGMTEPVPEPAVSAAESPREEPLAPAASQAAEQPLVAQPAPGEAGTGEPQPMAAFVASEGEPAPAPESAVPPIAPTAAPAAAARTSSFDWESLIGVKLFSWIAGAALVLAAIFFLRYSVEQGWFSPSVRATIGLLAGIGLLIACELRVARNYAWTANAMNGAGIAILYSTLYAMYGLWHLLPPAIAFFFMLVVTAIAVFLSVRRDSVFIAILGLMGGFATPALLSTGENRPIALFSYLLLLNAGLAWVAFKKNWPALTLGSLIFTIIYQWSWIASFMTSAQFPLAAGIFVVFAIVGTSAMWTRARAGSRGSFRNTAIVAAIVPLAFALFGSAVPAYGARYNVLFGFLLMMAAGLGAIAVLRGPEWLHVLGGLATVLTFVVWSGASYRHEAWPAILLWLAIFVVLYLGVPLIRRRPDQPPQVFGPTIDRASITSAILFVLFAVLAGKEPATASAALLFGAMFALLIATGVFAAARGSRITWWTAASFAVVAEAVWTAHYLDRVLLGRALVTYVVAALILLVLPALSNELAAAAVIGLTAHVFLMVAAAKLPLPPWPLFIALAIIDGALFAVAIRARRPSLMIAGVVESQLVLMVWTLSAPAASPWPSVALVATLLVAAWSLAFFFAGARFDISQGALTGVAASGIMAGSLAAAVAGAHSAVPLFAELLVSQAVLLIALLAVAWLSELHVLAVAAAFLAVVATAAAQPATPSREFVFAGVLYALFIAYPLLLGARAKKSIEPYLAAVFASVAFFFFARDAMMTGGLQWMIGFLPVGEALLMIALLVRILRFEAPAERQLTRLALVAAAALAFITVAIPLQLEKEWITLGWVFEAAALIWLFRRIPHRGLLVWSGALFAVVLARLVLNPAVFGYHPASNVAILNWYLYTYLFAAAAFFAGAWLWPEGIKFGRPATATGGTILLFALLNIEIADFYSRGPTLTFNFFSSSLAQDLTYTIGWAMFAVGMLIAGIVMHQRAPRVAAILLLVVTILKCFLHDLARLGGLYRVGSLLGLAASLVVVGLLLQRFVMARPVKPAAEQQA